jgi:hypothetical protein
MTPTASIPPVAPGEPVGTPETHRLMLAADRASTRIAKWGKPLEPDPRPIAFWPADFVGATDERARHLSFQLNHPLPP